VGCRCGYDTLICWLWQIFCVRKQNPSWYASNLLLYLPILTISQYYKPWELLPRDEGHIKTQIAEAEAIIEREVDEFYRQHPKEAGAESRQERLAEGKNTNSTPKETVGEPRFESPSVSSAPVDTTNPPAQDRDIAEKQPLEEHNGEVVVEAEEDTVIY
jgi:hypothetical protein